LTNCCRIYFVFSTVWNNDISYHSLFSFTLIYAIRKSQEKQEERLKLNGANQLLVYADVVNVCIGWKLKCHKENTETLLDDSETVNVEVNKECTILHVITRLHGATTQNTAFQVIVAMRTWNPTQKEQIILTIMQDNLIYTTTAIAILLLCV
jgi:hypothetical protein